MCMKCGKRTNLRGGADGCTCRKDAVKACKTALKHRAIEKTNGILTYFQCPNCKHVELGWFE